MNSGLIRHRVFEELRQDILTCGLKPGEELREVELAKRYGVSKSPIRDALQKLEFEGLIEIEPRRGHRVAPIAVGDAEDILEMRAVLEAACLRKIAAEATNSQLAALDDFREADTGNMTAFARYNREFHSTIARMSGNRRLAESVEKLMENYDRLCLVSLGPVLDGEDRASLALKDHLAIIDALQARNAAAAVRCSTRHVRRSRMQIMRKLDSRPIVG
ncbi:GntR family transcriptional regulator [Histidinibacterium lentulum]|uniref:GntR family transcriptional regulator n=1 Tax=Histidinibacterium lentulum TaxID=2480588 RepID=A0A3N2R9W6_9RHOB|nr:GntR family transcriptional regulator [Histidinibacterium lentulum]ROU04254.1 GntR family transcriptional regulator [Histidinibacterium lentulum]